MHVYWQVQSDLSMLKEKEEKKKLEAEEKERQKEGRLEKGKKKEEEQKWKDEEKAHKAAEREEKRKCMEEEKVRKATEKAERLAAKGKAGKSATKEYLTRKKPRLNVEASIDSYHCCACIGRRMKGLEGSGWSVLVEDGFMKTVLFLILVTMTSYVLYVSCKKVLVHKNLIKFLGKG